MNQTLIEFNSPTATGNLLSSLKMNEIQDAKAVAMMKVIQCHFVCNVDVRLFKEMDASVLLKVMEFANQGFTMQYYHREYLSAEKCDHQYCLKNCLTPRLLKIYYTCDVL